MAHQLKKKKRRNFENNACTSALRRKAHIQEIELIGVVFLLGRNRAGWRTWRRSWWATWHMLAMASTSPTAPNTTCAWRGTHDASPRMLNSDHRPSPHVQEHLPASSVLGVPVPPQRKVWHAWIHAISSPLLTIRNTTQRCLLSVRTTPCTRRGQDDVQSLLAADAGRYDREYRIQNTEGTKYQTAVECANAAEPGRETQLRGQSRVTRRRQPRLHNYSYTISESEASRGNFWWARWRSIAWREEQR